MNRRKWAGVAGLLLPLLLTGCDSRFVVLDPQGPVAQTQQKLIVISAILCAIVIIPVIALLVFIVWRYREKPGNKAPYRPDWADSKALEIVWWGIPIVIIGILGFFTARDTYALARPPVTDTKPIRIQVTSLDWKWLFQYPDQGIATVNYVHIPAGVPVYFQLTSDAPMNSFWIPQLGGQEYTMPGMAMMLWLQADKPGEYYGSGANFSGREFAHMRFRVIAEPQKDFNEWAANIKRTSPALTGAGYTELSKPGTSEEKSFGSIPEDLYDRIVNKNGGIYMHHSEHGAGFDSDVHGIPGHDGSTGESDSGGMSGMDHSMMHGAAGAAERSD